MSPENDSIEETPALGALAPPPESPGRTPSPLAHNPAKNKGAAVQKTASGGARRGSLAERLRSEAHQRAEATAIRECLRLDSITRRTADRVLAYARREGFDRDEPRRWVTRTGLRILEQSASVVLEHMRREGRAASELHELGQLMATWCRWGCWARSPAPKAKVNENEVSQ